MDGAECFKHKGMVLGGLKLLDPKMNSLLIKDIFKMEALVKQEDDAEPIFKKPKREEFRSSGDSSSSRRNNNRSAQERGATNIFSTDEVEGAVDSVLANVPTFNPALFKPR